MPAADVFVSLVNTDNRDVLRRCLASLRAAAENLVMEVAVLDNASSDGSAEMVAAEFPWATLRRNQRRLGFSANHNQLLRPALDSGKFRHLLILNEDTVLDPGSVARLAACLDRRPDLGAVGPLIRGVDGETQPSYFRFPSASTQVLAAVGLGVQEQAPGLPGWLNGSCVLVRAAALREVGALDERFFIFFEDTDLGLRLLRAGYGSDVCPEATILHLGHSTVAKPAHGSAFERQMHRSRHLYLAKHRGQAAAHLSTVGVRAGLAARATKAGVAGLVGRDPEERLLARQLAGLAGYNPWVSLPHEQG